MKFSYVSYISTYGITTLHTQDIFLGKIKNHANNLIGDHNLAITRPKINIFDWTFLQVLKGHKIHIITNLEIDWS